MTQALPKTGKNAPKKAPTRAEEKMRAFHEEGAIGRAYDFRLVKRLVPFVRPHGKFLAGSLVSLIGVTGLNLLRPLLMGDVVGKAAAKDPGGLLRDGVYLSLVIIGTQTLTFFQIYAMQIVGARAMADLREHIFLFFQRLQLRFFDRTPVGRLVTRATNDVDAVGELFASGVLNAVGDFATLAGIVVMMVLLDWQLSLIAFAALPIVGLIVNFVRKRSREAYRDIRTKTARLNAFLNEQVSGIAVVQAYAQEEQAAREFDDINAAYRDANVKSITWEALLDAAIEMVSTLCIASVLWWSGFHRVGNHAITFPLVVTFAQYIKQFFEPVSLLSQRYTILQSAMAGAERIFQLLDETQVEVQAEVDGTAKYQPAPEEAIALDDVTFEYKKGVPVLREVSMSAKAGEKIALVGATGAGKTTVSSLLLRLYEAGSGEVRVFGKNVKTYDRQALRENFSVVPQDVFLFSGTILSNVAMSDDTPNRQRAAEAIARIGALEIFRRRGTDEGKTSTEDGWLDARVDERGANFSAGERQLLAFARALYRDAPILILDEATASVDSDTEARLQVALDAVMEKRTAVVIAHRLSTIKAVDRIVVFHKGKVVETGSHEELLAKEGVYARLYRMQFAHERQKELEGASDPPPPVASTP
ncbi:MAG TPA: ABC transporter ATP-binding protein [Polyangiaceae bacterium]